MPITGEFKVSGITDEDVASIFKLKARYPGLVFNPQGMTTMSGGQARTEVRQVRQPNGMIVNQHVPVAVGPQTYGNCTFSWANNDGLRAAYTVLHKMLHGHDSEPSMPAVANAA